jgi:hypothetical protein
MAPVAVALLTQGDGVGAGAAVTVAAGVAVEAGKAGPWWSWRRPPQRLSAVQLAPVRCLVGGRAA